MVDANAASQGPEQAPFTTDMLLADIVQTSATIGREYHAQELVDSLALMATRHVDVAANDMPAQIMRATAGHGLRLQRVITAALTNEYGDLTDIPDPAEKIHHVAVLDGLLGTAAGQPVVLLKPGKTWLDVGLLERPRETDNHTGLQISADGEIQLPFYSTTTIDLRTGKEPSDEDDDELRARNSPPSGLQTDDPIEAIRPTINPLRTYVLLKPKDAHEIEAGPEAEAEHLLVGYPQLQKVLNRILGFDTNATSSEEAAAKLRVATKAQRRLEKVKIKFDLDFIDGVLAHQIDVMESAIEGGGRLTAVSTAYQKQALVHLKQKFVSLVELGWISAPSTS